MMKVNNRRFVKIYLGLQVFFYCSLSTLCIADDQEPKSTSATTNSAASSSVTEQISETSHSGKFNGKTISYTTIARDTHLKNNKGETVANIFSFYYRKDKVKDPTKRPITFVFNGGPGSSSVWLHMGVFGPKRINVPSNAKGAGAAPYNIEHNASSILDVTDLVFIDPVGTGFSDVIGEGKLENYWGLEQDAKSIAEFIRLFLTRNKRWNSPKFIAGESYGTTRAGQLLKELQSTFNNQVALNGVLLISSIVDFKTARFHKGNDLPVILFLPSYAATAWYHNKLPNKPENLEEFLQEVRDFAINEYSVALFKGNQLPQAEADIIINKLHQYTGLSKNYLQRTRLRINAFRFMKELLRDEGITVGRFDSRYTGVDEDDAGENFDNDASAYAIDGAYTASINDYMNRTLKISRDKEYSILNTQTYMKWDWSEKGKLGGSYTNVTPHIAKGLRENQDLHIYVANGYYDLATPFFATEYSLSHYGIDPKRVHMKYYEAGHMMYVHQPSHVQFSNDVRQFIQQTVKLTRQH